MEAPFNIHSNTTEKSDLQTVTLLRPSPLLQVALEALEALEALKWALG